MFEFFKNLNFFGFFPFGVSLCFRIEKTDPTLHFGTTPLSRKSLDLFQVPLSEPFCQKLLFLIPRLVPIPVFQAPAFFGAYQILKRLPEQFSTRKGFVFPDKFLTQQQSHSTGKRTVQNFSPSAKIIGCHPTAEVQDFSGHGRILFDRFFYFFERAEIGMFFQRRDHTAHFSSGKWNQHP